VLWGFGFVATVWCLNYLSPSAILFYRFFLAFLLSQITLLFFQKSLLYNPSKSKIISPSFHLIKNWFHLKNNGIFNLEETKKEIKIAFWPGLFLFFTMYLQTWGLKYTTATKSGFITILYVLIVPLIEIFYHKSRPSPRQLILTFLALVGALFMVQILNLNFIELFLHNSSRILLSDFFSMDKLSDLNFGDFLTFLCAITAAFHIFFIGIYSKKTKTGWHLNGYQSFWCALFSWPLALIENRPLIPPFLDIKFILGILALGIGSSYLGFYLQVKAQTKISSSLASMLFLMESPFAAFFGYLILSENISPEQILGAFLIFLSCLLMTLMPNSTKTN
jgi:drug/metabolite transporter (DMT)-like permease